MTTIDIPSRQLKFLPKNLPEVVNGSFFCTNNELTCLGGSPRIVGKDFSCSINKLTSFKHSPRMVGWGVFCWYNRLISLDFLPVKFTHLSRL